MQQLCSNGQGKNKVSYKTRAAAEKAARKTKSGLALRIYRCPRCFDWHLTSQEQRYKIEAPPSAAKLKRKLETVGREIAAQKRRFDLAEKALSDAKIEAACSQARAEVAHREELAYIQAATDKLFGK
jgi:hypothetical protein